MNSLLIVEGKSDKYIIDSLVKHLSIKNLEVGKPICNIDKCEDLNGTGELDKKLKALKKRVRKESIKKIGIIFDADSIGIVEQTENIKNNINLVFDESFDVKFFIHIVNVDGFGEIEDLLRKITTFTPMMANCLHSWQECLMDKKLTDKEFNKLWIQVYEKYDCCTKEEQRNIKDNCNKEILLKDKKVYNFDADIKELKELKKFLQELGEE